MTVVGLMLLLGLLLLVLWVLPTAHRTYTAARRGQFWRGAIWALLTAIAAALLSACYVTVPDRGSWLQFLLLMATLPILVPAAAKDAASEAEGREGIVQ